ncbi:MULTISPECIES: LytR/AlgR family response regulator transcription factor [Sphingobacterium]|uniref:LytR/AlgR family response regulator transcription factor n=1 Tax=Sphingobacterium TaxID=28453 RepID=UPI0025810FEB|nr:MULTISPECIES: LytTR family DNA-binding domain-containing protein [Sphingobacterium]
MRYHKLIDVDFNVPNRIFVQSNKKQIQLETENILYIVATGNYTKIITLTGPISIREKFSAFLEQLPKNDFVQVHKSFAVAPKQINSVEGNMIFISIIRFQLEKFIK